MGFRGVYIISAQKHRLWALAEAVLTSTHNICFEQKYEEYQNFLSEKFHILVAKFSVYLNRHVFVMCPKTSFHMARSIRDKPINKQAHDKTYKMDVRPAKTDQPRHPVQNIFFNMTGRAIIPIGMTLAIFDLQVTLIPPLKFRVNWPYCSEEVQNILSSWRLWRPNGTSDQNKFSYFLIYKSPRYILPRFE